MGFGRCLVRGELRHVRVQLQDTVQAGQVGRLGVRRVCALGSWVRGVRGVQGAMQRRTEGKGPVRVSVRLSLDWGVVGSGPVPNTYNFSKVIHEILFWKVLKYWAIFGVLNSI